VSESFVREYWPGENPIGKRFTIALESRIVAGVVGDVRVRGLERESEPQVYLPPRQVPDGWLILYSPKDLAIRTSGDPRALAPAVRRIIARLDPEQPIANVRTLDEIVDAERAPRLVQLRVLGAFAALAILLAATGIHALLSFAVASRRREIGVRVALGASPGRILGLVLRQGVLLGSVGTIAGLAMGAATGRAMQGLLLGVQPDDAATFATAAGVALAMTVAGTLIPALRCLRIEPTTAMRP
jgi:predicted lysophospholipase L1 biosynthesis ABC-type transport system permease subunit